MKKKHANPVFKELFDGSITPYARIGRDDRIQVTDINDEVNRWICQVLVEHSSLDDGIYLAGTAFLVDRKHLITAAHNVWMNGSMASKAYVYIGCHGDRENTLYGCRKAEWFRVHPRYESPLPNDDPSHYDLAVIRLSRSLPESFAKGPSPFGSMPVRQVNLDKLAVTSVYAAGYPVEYPDHDKGRYPVPDLDTQAFQYHCSSNVKVGNRMLHYLADTDVGQSGSPVIVSETIPGRPPNRVAIGVHVKGLEDMYNSAVPFDGDRLDFVRKAITETDFA